MNISKLFNQKGIGLIEVLIALLVVSLGLLALANFQGSLLQASGSNKARAEAIGIAQQEIELIRYAATDRDDFVLIPTNPASKTIDGTNALFTVTSDVDDPTANNIVNVEVNVAWTDAAGESDTVTLMSQVGLQDIDKSAFATNDNSASVAVPSPRQSASEDVRPASENVDDPSVISPTNTPLPATGTVGADENRASGLAQSFNVTNTDPEDNTTYELTAIADDSRYYNTNFGDGVLGVYVCESTDANGCRYVQNHFGGISLSTSGFIYSNETNRRGNDLSDIDPVWSSSEVTACFEGVVTADGVGGEMKPYECIYAGNCTDSPDSCQQGVTVDDVEDKGVGPGGEFGNLGLIGLDDSKGDQVCFLEDTPEVGEELDPQGDALLNGTSSGAGNPPQYNEAYLLPVTTRFYVTRRLLSNGEERSEGINQSFRNHNFLLVDRASNSNEDNCHLAVNENDATLETYVLAPRNIVRVRTDMANPVTNPVEALTTFNGVMPAITVSSSVSGDRPNLYIPEVGSCYVKNDNSKYACVVPNNTLDDVNDVTIYGKSASIPTPTTSGSEPAMPAVFETCTFDVDESEVGNIESYTISEEAGDFDCRWPTDF